jgi:hypothetical protein
MSQGIRPGWRRGGAGLPWLVVCWLCTTGCGLDVVDVDVVETTYVGGSALSLQAMDQFGSSLGSALDTEGVDPSDVDSLKVKSGQVVLTSRGGLTSDLGFMSNLVFHVQADGLSPARLAWKDVFSDGQTEADLQVDSDLELKTFLDSGHMEVIPSAALVPPPDLVEIEVRFKLRVDVNAI